MNWDLYLRLSALMFMEFAIWGAWMPVLAVRLLGPLKMSGKQTGWIYATLPLGEHFRTAHFGLSGRQMVPCRTRSFWSLTPLGPSCFFWPRSKRGLRGCLSPCFSIRSVIPPRFRW